MKNGPFDDSPVSDIVVKCHFDITLVFRYVTGSEFLEYIKDVQVSLAGDHDTPPIEATSEKGKTTARINRPGTYNLSFQLPEPFNEEYLVCDPAELIIIENTPLKEQPVPLQVTKAQEIIIDVQASYVQIKLFDSKAEPVPEEPYSIFTEYVKEDKALEGKLDENGEAIHLVPGKKGTQSKISFPSWYAHDFAAEPKLENEEFEFVPELSEPTINIQLIDVAGKPVPQQKYLIKFPFNEELEPLSGKLDEKGQAVVKVTESAHVCKYTVTFPGWYAHDFQNYSVGGK